MFEELLERVLVKDEEKPYDVLENWIWTRLDGIINDIKNGTTLTQNKENLGLPVTRIESIQNNRIDFNRLGYIADVNKIKGNDFYVAGNIALSHINSAEHVGKTAIITGDQLPLVHGMNLLRLTFNQACNPHYFYYFSQSYDYKQEIISRINMAVNQVSINQKQLKDIPIPLPPINEQQKIVKIIESLFEKLDRAKELTQNVLDSFENRKSSILHKAFKGELTKNWRKEKGKKSWKYCVLNDVILEKPRNGYSPNGVSYQTKYKNLTLSATTSGVFKRDCFKYVDITIDNESYLWLKNGDILIQRANSFEYVGTCAIYDGNDNEYIYPDLMMKVRANRNYIIDKYLYYALTNDETKAYFRNNATGTAGNMPKINQKTVLNTPIVLPPIEEQKEIVRILDNLFINELKSKELCDVIDNIDLMKKSILSRAFRGKLGTNNPEDESSEKLLRELLYQRNNISKIDVSKVKEKVNKSNLTSQQQHKLYNILLNEGKALAPEKLRKLSGLNYINEFYVELKKELEEGLIVEIKDNKSGATLLGAKK